ncbi:response regulator transcription factor [Demequina sp. SYSU T00039]|uniref:Response regulator transcription factor n=1 Tax=Demequina lignilytica TaxID=3051663 RepID=A0AAW7M4S4_9MICO|nr:MULTISPECIES: response regulator transcription factor [unclassified Demequina]MDN4478080.1 response regulator transcription factor [Demequina sp. SYSU T00039-1]MDN4488470.1 response regulator transcription factor [Demequina sp. SYSU T00039]MDN4489983.1 response regulator transcription factor [Demequina sp. SYSU T00068]
MRVLLVEDEERLVASLRDGLRTAGIETVHAGTGREGLALAQTEELDLMILDIGLPDQEGFTVLRRLRATGSDLPVIILTARTSAEDTVRGLERGADDYMAKPFSLDELLARIRLRARKAPGPDDDPVLRVGRCELDPIARTLTCDGEPVALSPRELQLAHLLMAAGGDVVSRARALDEVWGAASRDNVLDVYVGYLRSRLGSEAIETVRGVGYRFVG